MSTLLDLPAELLEAIFHYLGNIDDVHYFGRACKATHHVIRRSTVYTEIMRSVIAGSAQHRYDIMLCRMLDLRRDIVHHFTTGRGPLASTSIHQRNSHDPADVPSLEERIYWTLTSQCPQGPCMECLPDARVYDILARYQGLRVLEDSWLMRPLTSKDLFPADCSTDGEQFIRTYSSVIEGDQDFQDGSLSPDSCSEARSYQGFNADQRQRFYSAITSLWLLNDVRWMLVQFAHPDPGFGILLKALDAFKQWFKYQRGTTLIDELDRYAAFRFVYHHLLPLHGSFLADRDSAKLPLTFAFDVEKNPTHCARYLELFLTAGQTYLQPPDIIDLLIRSRSSRKYPYPLLTIPPSAEHYQRPSPAASFSPNINYTAPNSAPIHQLRQLESEGSSHLYIIARSTINQGESHPQTRPVQLPGANGLFAVVDDTAAWLKEKALTRFEMDAKKSERKGERLKDIREVFEERWSQTWWGIWWWANSEEKARAKMERWRVEEMPW